eukprot:Skav210257  [mRNA]  locus=scaffold1929:234102:234362:- [translate_table: standard]
MSLASWLLNRHSFFDQMEKPLSEVIPIFSDPIRLKSLFSSRPFLHCFEASSALRSWLFSSLPHLKRKAGAIVSHHTASAPDVPEVR